MSSSPASASSSSSQSSSDSWQPSQEANFQTASAAPVAHSSGHPHERLDDVVAQHRPVLADEQRPELAVPAVAGRARHAALQRQPDAPRRRTPRSCSAAAAKRIITSGPHIIATVARGVEDGAAG